MFWKGAAAQTKDVGRLVVWRWVLKEVCWAVSARADCTGAEKEECFGAPRDAVSARCQQPNEHFPSN